MTVRLTQKEYELRVNLLGVEVLGEYQGRKIAILHKCRCGRPWVAAPDNVLAGQKCSACKREQMQIKFSKPKETYEKELKALGIKLIGTYKNASTKTAHVCTCGRVFIARPTRVLQGDKCGICTKGKVKLLSHTDYTNQLKEKGIEVVPLENYINMRTKIKHLCVCGNEWYSTPLNVLNGWLCGCERSRGESEIKDWLTNHGFRFKQEFSFPDLKHKRLLRYDFAVFKENYLLCLIEFHGTQHFKMANTWHKSELDFKDLLYRDTLKRNYAKRKCIQLIEIRFDQNVFDELNRLLLDKVVC